MEHQFPHSEDSKGVHKKTHKEDVGYLRGIILNYLKKRGTSDSCSAIKKIADELPELEWISWSLIEAKKVTRSQTWIPPSPDDLLKLIRSKDKRYIQNGDQLLNAIIESLYRLDSKLQGKPSAVEFLWDKNKPKDENAFSRYVELHLVEDLNQKGIIVNREVEIKRGEKTDIHVDAVYPTKRDRIFGSVTVIIEVKGCWIKYLKKAMKTQLVDRYLKNNQCQHGLYLVGWYNCESWEKEDYRKEQAPKISLEDVRELFEQQAEELSDENQIIKSFVMNTALN